jgi:Arc/MetJ-type ribon-helix-helix transcriptional regulator
MPERMGSSQGITGYTHRVAKVMISLPDSLLERIDAEAARQRSSRSALIQRFARDALERRGMRLARRMRDLEGQAGRHGGEVAAQIKAGRPR